MDDLTESEQGALDRYIDDLGTLTDDEEAAAIDRWFDRRGSNGPNPAESSFERSWQPVDLTAVLDGTWQPLKPTVGRRSDGLGLFYPGKCHTVASESEAGKTWLALSAALDELRAENHVLFVDFEDDESGIVGRLLYLGGHRDAIAERFHYLRPTEPLGSGIHRDDLGRVLIEHRPTLAILDGITEGMVLHGLDPLNNHDAAAFGRALPRRIAQTGAAVASLDHVTKSREGRDRYALGAVHKLNGLDGAAYVLDNRKSFGLGIIGRSTIRIAKDRPGHLRKHALPGAMPWYGDLVLDSHGEEFAEVSVEPPHQRDDDWRPTALMEAIAKALEKHGELSGKKLELAVKGGTRQKRDALGYLILDGYVCERTPHKLLKPYPPEGAKP